MERGDNGNFEISDCESYTERTILLKDIKFELDTDQKSNFEPSK